MDAVPGCWGASKYIVNIATLFDRETGFPSPQSICISSRFPICSIGLRCALPGDYTIGRGKNAIWKSAGVHEERRQTVGTSPKKRRWRIQ